MGDDCENEYMSVTVDEGRDKATDHGYEFFDISSKNGNNVNNAFKKLIEDAY